MPLIKGRGAADLLKEHLFASICFEVIHLGVDVLVGGADPCVSDLPCHVSETMTFPEHSTRTLFPNDFDLKDPSSAGLFFLSEDLLSFRTPLMPDSLCCSD